jgi:hypothetical protein
MIDPTDIQHGLNEIAGDILPFLTAASAVGVLSMAFIQTIKDMFPLRTWFQRAAVAKWLAANAKPSQHNPLAAQNDLVRLSTDGDSEAFYQLPIEQLCGQINAALQVVLDYPSFHEDLLYSLAFGANPADLDLLVKASRPVRENITPAADLTDAQRMLMSQVADARNRVGRQAQRSVDGLQISVGSRWQYWLKFASIVLSVGLATVALYLVKRGTPGELMPGEVVLGGILAGVLGGFLAPVSRDLIAALQQLRQ